MIDFAPTEARIFATTGSGPASRVIARTTAPWKYWLSGRWGTVATHVGLIFASRDSVTYSEAHWDTNWVADRRISQLLAWRDAHPGRVLRVSDPLPISPGAVAMAHDKAQRMVGVWKYSRGHLVRLWAWRRLRLPIWRESRDRVVCSEAVGRVLLPHYPIHVHMALRSPEYLIPAPMAIHLGMQGRGRYIGDGSDLVAAPPFEQESIP